MHLMRPSVRVQRYVLAEGALRLIASKSDPCRDAFSSRHSHVGYRKTAGRLERRSDAPSSANKLSRDRRTSPRTAKFALITIKRYHRVTR